MKWKFEKRYLWNALIILAVVLVSVFFNYILTHNARFEKFTSLVSDTFTPIIAGAVLAYLLDPILKFWERYAFTPLFKKLFKKDEDAKRVKKLSRGFGVAFTIALFLIILIGGLYLVIPQVYSSLEKIVTDAPTYYNHITQLINKLNKDNSEISDYILLAMDRIYSQAIQYINNDILPNMDKIVVGITSGIVGGVKALLNIILSLIISIYVMAGKENLFSDGKKLLYAFFTRKHANAILRGLRYADGVFGGFINGKIIDSFIIGAICYCFMVFAQFDYAVLISIIIGVTNVIPYFGPFIGAIPSILILLMMNPKQGIVFAIFVIILQQVDGNIIGPIILGDRMKLSSMWILVAILVGGGFFGVMGMILGAPCFACIYALVGSICRDKLKKKSLPLNAEDYYDIGSIEEDGTIIPEHTFWTDKDEKKKNVKREKKKEAKEPEENENIDE